MGANYTKQDVAYMLKMPQIRVDRIITQLYNQKVYTELQQCMNKVVACILHRMNMPNTEDFPMEVDQKSYQARDTYAYVYTDLITNMYYFVLDFSGGYYIEKRQLLESAKALISSMRRFTRYYEAVNKDYMDAHASFERQYRPLHYPGRQDGDALLGERPMYNNYEDRYFQPYIDNEEADGNAFVFGDDNPGKGRVDQYTFNFYFVSPEERGDEQVQVQSREVLIRTVLEKFGHHIYKGLGLYSVVDRCRISMEQAVAAGAAAGAGAPLQNHPVDLAVITQMPINKKSYLQMLLEQVQDAINTSIFSAKYDDLKGFSSSKRQLEMQIQYFAEINAWLAYLGQNAKQDDNSRFFEIRAEMQRMHAEAVEYAKNLNPEVEDVLNTVYQNINARNDRVQQFYAEVLERLDPEAYREIENVIYLAEYDEDEPNNERQE